MYGCVGGRSYPQKLIIQPMLAYLNPAANVCWHIPGGTRVTFITASERSWVQFPEVILIIFDTNCSKQWGPRGSGAVTGNCQLIPGKEQTIGNRCHAFWSWGLNSVWLQNSVWFAHLWQFQPLQHLWKGTVTWKDEFNMLLVLYICSLLPSPQRSLLFPRSQT